jgi:transposase
MTIPLKYSVGFDCSKDDYEACVSIIDSEQKVTIKATRKFKNTKKGFEDSEYWVSKHHKEKVPIVIVMEATGNYYENLAFFFHQKGYRVNVVLPNKAKKYMESRGIKTKNDPVDARGLSQMGAEQQLRKWEPYSEDIYKLRMLTRQDERLSSYKTQLSNQLHSLEYSMYENKLVQKQIKDMLMLVEKQIEESKKQIELLVTTDPKMQEKVSKILPVTGLGVATIAAVIAETNGFELIESLKQLTSYAGYDVIENQSGKRVGKTRISKKGNSHIRRAMYFPALSAVRWGEKSCVNLYERVYERTKIKMKGYVAVQRKLLCLIYTLWKKNEVYDPNFDKSSGNNEPKPLFQLSEEKKGKKVAPTKAEATLDGLPCKKSPEALFQL